MPRYNDDQCEMCGTARVSGSRLCVGCLLRLYNRALRRGLAMARENEKLERKNEKLKELVERLLDHIVQEAAYGDELQQARYLEWLEKEGGG